MAGEGTYDPAKSLEYKEKGNASFKRGDWTGAESYYTKAITHDKSNPLLYTNRAFALLKMSAWQGVIADSQASIALQPHNMKGYYYLAQAEAALSETAAALLHAKEAHRICVADGPKGQGSLTNITELVLRCKKVDWERRENIRIREKRGLVTELEDLLRTEGERVCRETGVEGEERKELESEYERKIELLRTTFEVARMNEEEELKRRIVPDWAIDNISFAIMVDPVVTITGQSYDRSTIMEHLKQNPTDPLTREPMTLADVRTNLALKEACNEFLEKNGWAVDY